MIKKMWKWKMNKNNMDLQRHDFQIIIYFKNFNFISKHYLKIIFNKNDNKNENCKK